MNLAGYALFAITLVLAVAYGSMFWLFLALLILLVIA